MKVPFLSFEERNKVIRKEVLSAFETFFDSCYYVLGTATKDFEKNYADFNKTKYAVGVGSGLEALHLALVALGVGKGDEVIVPSNTYIASVLAVTYTGATPIFVEPRLSSYNINPDLIEDAITPKTKVIMPVHLYGQACEMGYILDIAKKHGLYVVEDNAQAHGATFNGQLTGSFGDVNGVSFYPTKNLGAIGEAGAVTTDNKGLAQKIQVLRNYGSQKRYYNEVIGYNNRIDEFEATFLNVTLKYLKNWNKERKKNAQIYIENLENIDDLILPSTIKGASHVYHLFVIRTERRDELHKYLSERGISTVIHYPIPPHLQKCYEDLGYSKGDFPISEKIAETCLSLPNYIGISKKEISRVIEIIKEFYN